MGREIVGITDSLKISGKNASNLGQRAHKQELKRNYIKILERLMDWNNVAMSVLHLGY